MKKSLIFLMIWATVNCFGQTLTENWIKTITYNVPTADGIFTNEDGPMAITDADRNITVTYFDGLGRPIQKIEGQKSANGKDIINHIEYDSIGLPMTDYLAYPSSQTDQAYIDMSTAKSTTESYYSAVYGDNNPYAKKEEEPSPLGRIIKQSAPGDDWAMGNGHEVKMVYSSNTSEEVRMLKAITTPDSFGAFSSTLENTDYYPEGTLFKNTTFDENSAAAPVEGEEGTVEFKDKHGHLVMKRIYGVSVVDGVELTVSHDTYFVYDQYNNLSFVIPPLVDAGQEISDDILNGLCYQYRYDGNNRLVEKKLPGKNWEYLVYDKLDRLVATGPANSPFPDTDNTGKYGWMINKYDAFNRIILTGWVPEGGTFDSSLRSQLQGSYNGLTILNESKSAADIMIRGVACRYTHSAIPSAMMDILYVLTINYFDDYNYTGAPTLPVTVENVSSYYDNASHKPKGLLTGSFVRVPILSTLVQYNFNYIIYDRKARALRNYTSTYLGGYAFNDTKYRFDGQPERIVSYNKRTASNPGSFYKVTEDLTYTPQGRLLKHTHQIGNGPVNLLSFNTYNELGQLIEKKVGGTDLSGNTGFIQKVDYKYNVRGWLTAINDKDHLHDLPVNDLFALKINYNTTESSQDGTYIGESRYNGNISETYWVTANDNNVVRKYGYFYDKLNRLHDAWYMKPNSINEVSHSYDEDLSYDKNGNIITLHRNGMLDSDSGETLTIDDLYYSYNEYSNKVRRIDDSSNVTNGFINAASVANEYLYDGNGNVVRDYNKGISSIAYNQLNQPLNIAINDGISYIYDANGLMLRKTVRQNQVSNSTDYLWGFQYKFRTGQLEFLTTAEGYVQILQDDNGEDYFRYVYNYKDHLGNIRLSYAQDADGTTKILEENNYYPFGLKHENYNAQTYQFDKERFLTSTQMHIILAPTDRLGFQYKFQGQEWQDELGLNIYFFKFRMSDPATGRFLQLDPLAPTYSHNSPYAFAENNVTSGIDLEGLELSFHLDGNRATAQYGPRLTGGANGNYTVQELRSHLAKKQAENDRLLKRNMPGDTRSINTGDIHMPASDLSVAKHNDPFVMAADGAGIAASMLAIDGAIGKGLEGIAYFAKAEESVWGLNSLLRGRRIEAALGENLGWNFPTIDKIVNKVATSIKSMDLTAPSYKEGNKVFNTLKGYIDKLANFSQTTYKGIPFAEGTDFTSKAIELAIEPGKGSTAQWEQLGKAIEYAKQNNITFTLKFIK